jgi:hypothetical protein
MVSNNINRSSGTFKIMTPNSEGFEDSQEFFVMHIVVQFRGREGPGMESDWVHSIVSEDGKDCSKSIIGGVGFHDERSVRNPLDEGRSGGESGLEAVEDLLTRIGPVLRRALASKASQRNGDVGVIRNKTTVEISKT